MKEREIHFSLQTLAKVCSVYVCIMKAAVYIPRVNKACLCWLWDVCL